MPHSLGPLVVAAAVADLVGLLFVTAILVGLQQAFPRHYMRSWSWSWLSATVRSAGGILAATLPPLAMAGRWTLTLVILLAYYLQITWLLVGTRELSSGEVAPPRLRRIAIYGPVLLALVSTILVLADSPFAVRTFTHFVIPSAALGVAALVAVAELLRRPHAASAVGVRLMAGALGLYGLVRVHDVVIHLRWMLGARLPGYPAYLGFVDLAVMTVFGLGAVVSLLDDERDRLRVAEAKFARVFRSSPDVIAVTLPREGGLIVDINQQFERILGYGREEAVGKTTVELGLWANPADRFALWEEGQRGLVRDREVELRTKSGERRPFSLGAETFEVEGRTFAVAVARDMSDRLRAADELRRSEAHLRLALDAAGVGTWELDTSTGLVTWSEGSELVLGVTKGVLPRTLASYLQLVHADDRETVREALRGTLHEQRDFLEEHRVVAGDGGARWVEGRGRIQRDASGRPLLIRGTVVDVSARKEAEQALRESEERFRRLAGASFEGVATSEAGVVIEANEQLAEMLGCRLSDLVGRSIQDFVAAPSKQLVQDHLVEGAGAPYQHLARRADGSFFPVEVRARTVPYRGRTVRLSAIRDISERVEAERRQRRLEADLRNARIMESLGSLVAGVAHEARNPLFSITATLDAMERGLRSQPKFADYATRLRSEVARLTRLTQDLLDYGRPSRLQQGEARIADVVSRAARSCTSLAAERQVRIEIEMAPDLPALEIDAVQMERACANLITNALQHAPAGSVVRIGGSVERDPRPAVLVSVEDEGPGVPAEHVERVFEPFFTRRSGGTGLGLSIVQRVVEAHAGQVAARNRAQGGACFSVRLPLGPAAETKQAG
jgi:PAS domain S-box-containing protein